MIYLRPYLLYMVTLQEFLGEQTLNYECMFVGSGFATLQGSIGLTLRWKWGICADHTAGLYT